MSSTSQPTATQPTATPVNPPRQLLTPNGPRNTQGQTNVPKVDNFDKNIQTRQRNLHTVLTEYNGDLDSYQFVTEMITHCQNSGLDQHKGLIISAIMKKCPIRLGLGLCSTYAFEPSFIYFLLPLHFRFGYCLSYYYPSSVTNS